MLTIFVTTEEMESMSKVDLVAALSLSIGRILRMGSRPMEEGDVEMYEKCKLVFMAASEVLASRSQHA